MHDARFLAEADRAVRTGRDAVTTSVANVGLNEDGIVLRLDDRVGRADFHAARVFAMLADVRHQKPRGSVAGDCWRFGNQIDELDVAPVFGVELPGVVVGIAELRRIAGESVPLLARDLAGFAADADARIGKESNLIRHR